MARFSLRSLTPDALQDFFNSHEVLRHRFFSILILEVRDACPTSH